ncbi:hypothetical protein ATANTOWER_002373 [Ataeniobius toweri]|uniref:Secreted protein n=1 Tax=Ataeniobius toweri TaxID=208326 RepID=A0ABU7A0S7_9TELE|nr:hypothetical protein [Ataeniobius toweri]
MLFPTLLNAFVLPDSVSHILTHSKGTKTQTVTHTLSYLFIFTHANTHTNTHTHTHTYSDKQKSALPLTHSLSCSRLEFLSATSQRVICSFRLNPNPFIPHPPTESHMYTWAGSHKMIKSVIC